MSKFNNLVYVRLLFPVGLPDVSILGVYDNQEDIDDVWSIKIYLEESFRWISNFDTEEIWCQPKSVATDCHEKFPVVTWCISFDPISQGLIVRCIEFLLDVFQINLKIDKIISNG